MSRVKGNHPVDMIWANTVPGSWQFDPINFNLPAWPIPSCALQQHPKANSLLAHLAIGKLLGHVDLTQVGSETQWVQTRPKAKPELWQLERDMAR